MERRTILAFLAIVIVTTGFIIFNTQELYSDTVADDIDLGADASCSVLADFYAYNDGERVSLPIVAAPWIIHGEIVTDLAVNVSWTASGQYMVWSSLRVLGSLKLWRLDYVGTQTDDITSNVGASLLIDRAGLSAKVDWAEFVLPLSLLLGGVSPSGVTGEGVSYWSIKGIITVSGEVTDDYGDIWNDNTGEMTHIYNIYDAAAGFTISGDIN